MWEPDATHCWLAGWLCGGTLYGGGRSSLWETNVTVWLAAKEEVIDGPCAAALFSSGGKVGRRRLALVEGVWMQRQRMIQFHGKHSKDRSCRVYTVYMYVYMCVYVYTTPLCTYTCKCIKR